jgi:hypothetical protein
MTAPRFVGYWLGYPDAINNLLNTTPTAITNINLFVAGITDTGSQLNTNYLCKQYPASQLIDWSQDLQRQGQQVSMSLMDSGSIHWNNVDIATYVQSVNDVAITGEWGLDGIDIDAESGMPANVYVDTMVNLVNSMRAAIGPDKLLTYTCYTLGNGYDSNFDAEILPQIADSIDWINTMGYFWPTSQMETAFNTYAKIVGPEKVAIGVGCGYGDGTEFTPLSECATLASWQPASATKAGMMMFNINNDCPAMSGQPIWTWTDTIANNLTGSMKPASRAVREPGKPLRMLPR